MLPRVSVVMSNYNGVALKLVEASLASILKNSYPNLEIILVDNASTDASTEVITRKFSKNPRLKLLQNPVNMYSQGLNLGIKNSTGKYIAFFNNDATVGNGYFETMINFMEKNKDVALAQGKLLSSKNNNIIDCVGETMDIFGNPSSIGHGEKEKNKYTNQTDILSVTGSCSMLRKNVTEKIGFFDNEYGIGYEDMDFALRARMYGYNIVYVPNAYVHHKRGATDLAPMIRNKVKWHFNKNRITTVVKNYPLELLVFVLPSVIILYTLLACWEILIKQKIAWGISRFTAIIWVMCNFSDILAKRSYVQKIVKKRSFSTLLPFFSDNMLDTIGRYITNN